MIISFRLILLFIFLIGGLKNIDGIEFMNKSIRTDRDAVEFFPFNRWNATKDWDLIYEYSIKVRRGERIDEATKN